MGKKSEKYINENCNDKDFIKKFMSIKKGDYFLYKAYQNIEEKVKCNVSIGIVEEDFENGYELSHILGHTLPVKWMHNFDTVSNCKVYTSEFYKLNNNDISSYLEIIKSQDDHTMKSLFGVCQVMEGFDKEKVSALEGGYFFPVRWIEYEKENIDGNAWVIFENNSIVEKYVKRFTNKMPLNTILYGPPGTGKTYNTKQMVYNLVSETSLRNRYYTGYLDYKNNVEFCTFHQSYGYEEFIEGLKSDGEGNFKPEDGILKDISIEACYNALKFEKKMSFELEKDSLTLEIIKDRKKKLVLENIEYSESFNFEESENIIGR